MSFLKISDPAKRDAIVKEYLDLKKNIWDNLLSERTGESELQTELTKFYRPITETQKATKKEITEGLKPIREITEGLKPIREGIEKLPQAIGEEASKKFGEKEDESVGEIAKTYLNIPIPTRDTTFGINKRKDGHHYIGDTRVIVHENNIIIDDEKFEGTPGLWKLIMLKDPTDEYFTMDDHEKYGRILVETHVLHHDNNPNNPHPKSSGGDKWRLLAEFWKKSRKSEGKGIVIMPSDPNALLERLDLLLASQEAGHTGVGNELVSICDELKRQGVLDAKAYKKLNSIIKNDST